MTPHEQIKQDLESVLSGVPSNSIRSSLALLETHTLVPNEPTEEMVDKGLIFTSDLEHHRQIISAVYKAMVKASKGTQEALPSSMKTNEGE